MKTFAFAALAVSGAMAANVIQVTVGKDSLLAFSPTSVTAAVGDTIQFTFYPKNHTVVQSTLKTPCAPLASGFATTFTNNVSAVPADLTTLPTANFTVTNASAPLWFYCSQTAPISHCGNGMVFAVNPGQEGAANSFTAFQNAAKGAAGNSSSSGNSTTGAPGPSSGSNSTGGNGTSNNTGGGSGGSAVGGVSAPLSIIVGGALAAIAGAASLL